MYAMQPITYMTGSEIQAPYRTILQPGNIESGVGFGPASRAGGGEILARHVSQPGMVWAKFSSQNTRAVDQYDPMVSGALQTQWALASQPHNTLERILNGVVINKRDEFTDATECEDVGMFLSVSFTSEPQPLCLRGRRCRLCCGTS